MMRPWVHLLACAGACFLAEPAATFSQEVSPEELQLQITQAVKLNAQGKYADAAALVEKLLPAAEELHGKTSAETAKLLNSLAYAYTNLGQYTKAESLYERSLAIREAKFGKNHVDVAESLNNLADLYRQMGLYTTAEPLLQRSLQIYETNGKDIETVPALTNLAELYKNIGRYTKAESLFRRGLQIREQKLDKNNPKVALSLFHLARFYHYMGDYENAEPLYVRSQQIWEAKQFAEVAYAQIGLADLYAKTGENAKAEPFYRRGCDILEKKRGANHPDLAFALNNLAGFYDSLGKYSDAENLYQRSLKIYESNFGMDHPNVAIALSNLAGVYDAQNQFDKAEPLLQRTLEINESKLGNDHPNVAKSHHNVARNAASQQQWLKAVDYFQKARQGTARHLSEILPALSEREQLKLLDANFERGFHRVLSLGWAARAEASAASAEWLLNGKAVAHQSLAEQKILAREAQDPQAKQLVESLQRARARLAALVNLLPKPGREADYQKEIHDLRSSESELAQKLARAVGRPFRADPWISLDQLRDKLGPQTAFIDIARFSLFDFVGNKKMGPRYVAWITPPRGTGEVQLIDLGAAEPIDRLVIKMRQALVSSARSVTEVGEIEAADALQKPLQELAAKVLHPLLPAIERYDDWIVCPDGALWLTPWHALLLKDGKFAVEKYQIRHVVSGRDLVLELPKARAESAYVFADPDYDRSPGKVSAEIRSTGSLGLVPKVPRLPGTAAEAEAVRAKLKHWLGQEPKVFLQGKASETMVKAVKNPRVLVLATHGYFLPKPATEGKANPGQRIENPLLRCGLLLAGCNKRAEATADEDDGILSGLEILGLNLTGCELVVLSACETGLGDVRSGEGVAGMRQAFQLAGAKGVLASLWQVPDRETARLMNTFYDELAKGRSQATALRQAQLERIGDRRARFGAAHPFFWSAFALTGRGD